MSIIEKTEFIILSFRQIKLKTFVPEPAIARFEYVEIKTIYFLHQALHH